MNLNEQAVRIAVKMIAQFEGCHLVAYPDPASPLYGALSRKGILTKYMEGKVTWCSLPDNFKALSGHPWTVGYGETLGVTKDTVMTLEEATAALNARTRGFMAQCIKDCPKLALLAPERIAAITSLAYNIGNRAFAKSTACKRITSGDLGLVDEAILMWNKAGGRVMEGLNNRRRSEAAMWNSVRG